MSEMHEQIPAFFDDFNEAFAAFDGDRVAAKFSLPFLAHDSRGMSKVFHGRAELARYYQAYLDEYRARGCVLCRYSDLQVTMMGGTAAAATVRWSLLDNAMGEVLAWRETYLLDIGSVAATAFATIDHA